MSNRKNKPRPAPQVAESLGVTTASEIEPMLVFDDLPRVLSCSRRTVERLRASGKFPKPDLLIGTGSRKSPRWKPETIRRLMGGGDL